MDIASLVFVLFLMIVMGWIARKAGVLDDVAVSRFSAFLLKVSLPSLILVVLERDFSTALLRHAGAVLCLSFAVYGAAFAIAFVYPKLIGASRKERGVHSYALIFSNVAYMGYPVVEAVLGKEALFSLAIYNISFLFLAFGLGAWFISRDGNGKLRVSLKLLLDPCVFATVLGFIVFLFSYKYPAPLGKALRMVGDTTSPLSMIIIGAVLGRMDVHAVFGRWRTYVTSAVRLVVLPLLFGAVLYLLGFRGTLLALPVLAAALPVAAATTIVANVYEGDVDSGSALVFISTLACVVTVPVVATLVMSV